VKPLDGLRVLDFSHMLSGPTCTAMLGLLGAEVVKIERQGSGDGFRHYTEHAGPSGMSVPFAVANTGKRSITLDMKHARARDIVRRLAKRSDIVVENFRPGVPASLGLDWNSLKAINPRLVYCSITGFGHTGPLRDWPALDQVVQAISSAFWMNGGPEDGPIKIGFPVMDTFTGYMAVIAILAALRRRDATGVGEFIDVAMLDCALKLMAGPVATHLYTGELPPRTGNRGYRDVATADMYRTADGYIVLGANLQPQFEKFCRILGREDILADARFRDHAARAANNDALRATLTELLATENAADLEAKLASAEVPAAMVRNLAQIIHHPQFDHRSLLHQTPLPGSAEPVTVVGAGFEAEGEPLTAAPPPGLGEHTDAVLVDLGYDAMTIASLHADGVV
jgi:crotonobetainyl-CoA:carnitine CoA-transferase CaiB-like acyl-CoA transferase